MNGRDDRSADSQSNRASTPRCREPEKHADQGEDDPQGEPSPTLSRRHGPESKKQ